MKFRRVSEIKSARPRRLAVLAWELLVDCPLQDINDSMA